jgi:hypothetical protein
VSQDGQEFLVHPAAEKVRGTNSVFEGLRNSAKRGVDACLAKTFAEIGQIVDAKHITQKGTGQTR